MSSQPNSGIHDNNSQAGQNKLHSSEIVLMLRIKVSWEQLDPSDSTSHEGIADDSDNADHIPSAALKSAGDFYGFAAE